MPRSKRELAPLGIDAGEVIKHFLGKSREEVEAGEFRDSLHMEDFSYMTCIGVEYYLPCVLRIMMRPPAQDALWIHLHGFLKPGEDCELWWNLQELNRKQLGAIAIWAECLGNQWRDDPPADFEPDEALVLAEAYRRLSLRKR